MSSMKAPTYIAKKTDSLSRDTVRRIPSVSLLTTWYQDSQSGAAVDLTSESTLVSSSTHFNRCQQVKDRHRAAHQHNKNNNNNNNNNNSKKIEGKNSNLFICDDPIVFSVRSGSSTDMLHSAVCSCDDFGQSRPPTPSTPHLPRSREGDVSGRYAGLMLFVLVLVVIVLSYPGDTQADLRDIQRMFDTAAPTASPSGNHSIVARSATTGAAAPSSSGGGGGSSSHAIVSQLRRRALAIPLAADHGLALTRRVLSARLRRQHHRRRRLSTAL